MKNERTVTLRISDELLQKLEFIAEKEGRTLNNHLILLARNNISYYERTHDKIKTVQRKIEADDEKETAES